MLLSPLLGQPPVLKHYSAASLLDAKVELILVSVRSDLLVWQALSALTVSRSIAAVRQMTTAMESIPSRSAVLLACNSKLKSRASSGPFIYCLAGASTAVFDHPYTR
jgi:hypothetical protein